MQTRSSVLGKRHARAETTSPPGEVELPASAKLPPTPENTPSIKRFRSSSTIEDGDNNKENIPPLRVDALRTPTRRARSLRRTTSEIITPSSTRSTPRGRSFSVSRRPTTPATSVAPITLATPPSTPPAALLPICARARALLRPTANGLAPLAGRDKERGQIKSFIGSFLDTPTEEKADEDEHAVLYISGTPGTGKTALITSMLHDMHDELEDAKVATVMVNCMALKNIDALRDRLVDEFMERRIKPKTPSKQRRTKETSLEALERLLSCGDMKCVVVLDELDHLASSSNTLTPLFSLIHKNRAHVRLIGVANTHTLSAAISSDAMVGVQTMHFEPYTATQLLAILQARLSPLSDHENPGKDDAETKDNFLPHPTLLLLTKKIAAQTGDVRAVMQVLRCAIDIAVNTKITQDGGNPLAEATPPVTPAHVLSALKAYAPAKTALALPSSSTPTCKRVAASETVNKIQALGLQPRLGVLSMFIACKRLDAGLPLSGSPVASAPSTPRKNHKGNVSSSTGNIDVGHLHSFYKTILARADDNGGAFAPVSRSEFGDLMNMLDTVGLVSLSSSTGAFGHGSSPSKRRTASFGKLGGASAGGQEVRFVGDIRMDEVARGLGLDNGEKDATNVKEEEVRSIWARERTRIAREAKAHAREIIAADAFDEAQED